MEAALELLELKERALLAENAKQREIIREQGEFIQKLKRDIRDFLGHPSLGR